LVLLSLATTLLVVISFLLPLGLLVRRQAANGAKVEAEQDAQSVASLVALAVAVSEGSAAVADAVGDLPAGTIVVLSANEVLGEPLPGQGALVPAAASTASTVTGAVEGGWEIALPVLSPDETVVVSSFATDEELTEGVLGAWLLLALLGTVLVGAAVLVADRMGRGLTAPIEELATSAHRLADGDLDARVEPSDPEELRQMGEAFNYLAGRLETLLAAERETVADLSHRLRTPLTSLRLQSEGLSDPDDRLAMVAHVDRLEHAMNQVIEMARTPAARDRAECELNAVVSARAEFWRLLAEEQARELDVDLATDAGRVALDSDSVAAVLDTLIDNVFSHTAPGTRFGIETRRSGNSVVLEVSDEGGGFGSFSGVERGVSGGGSTGLGLDIVRKMAESTGGGLSVSDGPDGGAIVTVRFG
jgi:signal transduction histidine kinase